MTSVDPCWTAFCFQHEANPNSLHCTHKFLGTLSSLDAKAVEQLISNHLRAAGGFQRFKVTFNRVDHFGEAEDIRVLLPEDESDFWQKYYALGFDGLREELDAFRHDDWKFTPHVTTKDHAFLNDWFDSYVLMCGERIIKRWHWPKPNRISNDSDRYVELKPVREGPASYDEIEERIKEVFRKKLYDPLLSLIRQSKHRLENSRESLLKAIAEGRISHNLGLFTGSFDASVSKELKALGATWDREKKGFRILLADLPKGVQSSIRMSEERFRRRLMSIDKKLRQNLPAEIAESIKTEDIFNRQLWKVDKDIRKTLQNITVTPELSQTQRKRISAEWQNNMDYWIQNFAEEEIRRLRSEVAKNVASGNRYEALVETIQASYGVTSRKAKFLARQETKLLLAKYKEVKYQAAGVEEYTWRCVVGSPAHPVRPSHKILDRGIFRYDDPPITTAPSEPVRRNNPGQDYNCRCYDIPIVRF